ncbi:MAG: adenylate kinase [Actinomycetota bacterium]|nr:MAG: adenylate kinase [Actinomycetota bacterium]
MARTRERNIVLLGAPGSGKGTQAERIVARYGLPHIATGDMLRAAIAKGTEMGREARRFMDAGELVPDEVVIGVVRERLTEDDAREGFLLDGFPRTIGQAERLDALLGGAGRGLTHVIQLDVPEDELAERLAGRRLCRACGKGYHVVFDPPARAGVCDACGGELYQRADDDETTVRNRLAVYRAQTEPLVEHYRAKCILSIAFGGGKMPDEVFEQVAEILGGAAS